MGAEGNLRDIVLSVAAGFALMLAFASVFAVILFSAWGLARARRWWEDRNESTDP